MSTERVIADRKIADALVDKLAAKARTLRAGDPTDPTSVLGAMVSIDAAKRVQALVEDARAHGAALPVGLHVDGAIVQPAIVDGVTPAMRLYREESFGPVVTVACVDGDEDAIRLANDSEYGLSASVFSRDVSRAMQVAQRIESGICHINGPTVHDEAQMPFGGVKSSGYGRFGGKASIAEFTELRWVTLQNTPRHYPI
jgi:acyl-CoA reductase-like NAD-dependent aldehyde dehydrogenase